MPARLFLPETVDKNKYVGVLWRFAGGHTRAVYRASYHFEGGQEITAKVVESTLPLNPGDSGGALFNSHCELVAINSSSSKAENQIQKSIDIEEVLAFLAKPGRDLSLTVFDAERSQITNASSKLCYAILACNRGDKPPVVTHRFHVTTTVDGEVIVSPLVAEMAAEPGLIK